MVLNSKNIVIIVATLVVALIFQLVFVLADGRDTPVRAAVEFTKDYFLMNESMGDRLCSELISESETDPVKAVILAAGDDAGMRGFDLSMVRRSLSHIETETISQDAETAKIKLSASSRVCINPVFAWVATLFKLGETREVEAVLSLVKEGSCWKVCGTPFGMGAEA